MLYRAVDRKMHDQYLQSEPSHFKDFAFFLSKLHVKDLGETFKINVPDVILFQRTEPIFKMYCTDPYSNIVHIERERDKLQLPLIDPFFKKRNDEDCKMHLRSVEDSKSKDKSDRLNTQAPRIVQAFFCEASKDTKRDSHKSGRLL